VLTHAISLERFEPIPRWDPQIFKPACNLQLPKFATRHRFKVHKPLDTEPTGKDRRVIILERNDHPE
jgi:hypothetical protein